VMKPMSVVIAQYSSRVSLIDQINVDLTPIKSSLDEPVGQ
jgi:hypothetical protein